MMMMVGVILGLVGVIVVVDVIDQDQDQLTDLSSAFCSSSAMRKCIKCATVYYTNCWAESSVDTSTL